MPYKDPIKAREASKERMKRYREQQQGVTRQGVTGEGVTRYRPILYALTDPNKRQKLERICESLARHNVLGEVWFGCGVDSTNMEEAAELLTAFR